MLRWHSWIAQSPPKGQVGGSNPPRGTNKINVGYEINIIIKYLGIQNLLIKIF